MKTELELKQIIEKVKLDMKHLEENTAPFERNVEYHDRIMFFKTAIMTIEFVLDVGDFEL